ncbi:hypothetical protein [Bradyrhizobium murdochi]|uniref:hypothetical protein n=1 Tax=Bradyrhizobium murdochi TaxID=1038859 RepID=UPI00048113A8|nr:hypothetical protein [Bradyrhizobium murdochi]
MAARSSLRPDPENVPAVVASKLKSGESVEAVFDMGKGLDIYATDRRFFGKRGERLIDIAYEEVTDVKRRASRGIVRSAMGIAFVAGGALTGFETPMATTISILLFLIGAVFLHLGLFMREHWVELRIRRDDPKPSVGHIVMFFPFWLLLRHGKRYTAPGSPEQVDAFCRFLSGKLSALPNRR